MDQANEHNDETEKQVRKSIRNRKLPHWMTAGEYAWLSETDKIDSYSEAMKSQEHEQWLNAMHEELSSLKENDTWELVTRPQNAQIIQNRWVLRIKTLDDGNP